MIASAVLAMIVMLVIGLVVRDFRKRRPTVPAGVEVLNEDGVVIVGLTDHHPRILGVRTMVEGSETVSVPEFSNGVPFVFTSFVNSLNSDYLEAGAIHAASVVTTSAGFTWSTTSKEAMTTGMPSFGNGVAVYGVSNEQ